MPSGSPFRNRKATFHGGGVSAKPISASQAAPIRIRIAAPRRRGSISEITLTPISLEAA